MTWTSEGQRYEDRLRKLWRRFEAGNEPGSGQEGLLRSIRRDLRAAELPYEQWEVLFRKLLLLERHIVGLEAHPPRTDRPRGSDQRAIAT